MPIIEIVQADILSVKAEALVNPTNTSLLSGGDQGVNGAVHKAAGPELFEACKRVRIQLGEVPTGDAVATPSGNLSAKYVIHAVGPVFKEGAANEKALLASVYRSVFGQVERKKTVSVAIPNISTGIYGFPKELAADIVLSTVKDYFSEHPDSVLQKLIFVCKNEENYRIYQEKFNGVQL